MNNYENLNGTLVAVRPDLNDDPVQQQGRAGVVQYAREADEIYVGFTNGKEGVYLASDLLQLKSRDEIFEVLNDPDPALSADDLKDLYKVMLLEERGTPTAHATALELATANPAIVDAATRIPVQDLSLQLEKSYSR